MSFDPTVFAAELRRALAGEPTDATIAAPTPTPAPAPELSVAKCDTGPFKWVLTPQRDADKLITSVLLEPVARASVE